MWASELQVDNTASCWTASKSSAKASRLAATPFPSQVSNIHRVGADNQSWIDFTGFEDWEHYFVEIAHWT